MATRVYETAKYRHTVRTTYPMQLVIDSKATSRETPLEDQVPTWYRKSLSGERLKSTIVRL